MLACNIHSQTFTHTGAYTAERFLLNTVKEALQAGAETVMSTIYLKLMLSKTVDPYLIWMPDPGAYTSSVFMMKTGKWIMKSPGSNYRITATFPARINSA